MEGKGPQKPMTDEQIEKIISEDPAAMHFLEGMLPGGANGTPQNRIEDDDLTNLNDLEIADLGN